MDTLAFGCLLPATGRIRVFHPIENVRRRAHWVRMPGLFTKCSPGILLIIAFSALRQYNTEKALGGI